MVNDVNKFIMPNGDEVKIDGLYGKITNCLLEVPQRIKLELNDGTLTLKAGSKAIVPNGFESDGTTPKFDYVDIVSDIITSAPYTNGPIFINYRNGQIGQSNSSAQCSGTSSTISAGYWYDTTNNFINRVDSGEVSSTGLSFPLAIINASNGSWASINQVFNGMGYIGSTVWVDKGVKGLIPNGRNEDGSLKNIERTTTNLIVRTLTNQNGDILVGSNLVNAIGLYSVTGFVSDEVNNINTNNQIIISKITATDGVISNFQPKLPFRAVDYSDKSEISGWGMPSYRYIDLTLGASGSTYTAPANGWISIFGISTTTSTQTYNLVELRNVSTNITNISYNNIKNNLSAFIPVRKDETITVTYSNFTLNGFAGYHFRFYYAEGSK